jgi:hypothetical protein
MMKGISVDKIKAFNTYRVLIDIHNIKSVT